ncbi:MAG TPA: glutamine-hydrolyzing GMP synthase, partial [Actinomycetota bacterium]
MPDFDTVLVVDFGAQYAQLIARRVRECRVRSEIVPASISAEEVRRRSPKGVILSGGPRSVYEPGAYQADPGIFDLGIPVLGICYGHQLMAKTLGGEVARAEAGEFGRTVVSGGCGLLFEGLAAEQTAWMSHNDAVVAPPEGFRATAASPASPV